MSKEEMTRTDYLELLKASADKLDRFLSPDYSDELLHFRPDLEDAWTIKEHLVAIVDTHIILYLLIRMAIAEPEAKAWNLGPFIRGEWFEPVKYADQPLQDTIACDKIEKSIKSEGLFEPNILSDSLDKDTDLSELCKDFLED